MHERTCQVCGERFDDPPRRGRPRMYCSSKCQRWVGHHLNAKVCSEPGCSRVHRAKGLCQSHYARKYMPDRHTKIEVECSVCGTLVLRNKSNNKARRAACSHACRTILSGHKPRLPRSTDLVGPVEVPARSTDAPLTVVKSAGGFWTSGPCSWCADKFVAWSPGTSARYCSRACSRSANKAARGRRFMISPILRTQIYERDHWTCWLCLEPVDRDLPVSDQWSASLDHVIPRSRQLIPDDSPANLRLAHRWCNSVRGDESYYTAADLAA